MPRTADEKALALRLFTFLGQIVEESAHKLRGAELHVRLCTDGLDIRVELDDVANHQLVTWAELAEMPEMLALRAGMAAGEAVAMRQDRDRRRAHDGDQARERRAAHDASRKAELKNGGPHGA